MLRETAWYDDTDLDGRLVEPDKDDLRSIMSASAKLPPTVIAARFSKIYDRILDDQTIAAVTDPSSFAQEDADERCRQRKKALVPYEGKRLVCVLISLPGVYYTVEIDRRLRKVVHWECHAQ